MSERAIHIIFDAEGKAEFLLAADSSTQTDWLQAWLRQNFKDARSSDPGGDSLHVPGASSLAGREKGNGKPAA
jgi:hypothetical protein